MTPHELKAMKKGRFIVMKTGANPFVAALKLYFKWGIMFDEKHPFELPDKGAGGGELRGDILAEKRRVLGGGARLGVRLGHGAGGGVGGFVFGDPDAVQLPAAEGEGRVRGPRGAAVRRGCGIRAADGAARAVVRVSGAGGAGGGWRLPRRVGVSKRTLNSSAAVCGASAMSRRITS
jgi:hypothetical protein